MFRFIRRGHWDIEPWLDLRYSERMMMIDYERTIIIK